MQFVKIAGFRTQSKFLADEISLTGWENAERHYVDSFAGKVGVIVAQDADAKHPLTVAFPHNKRCRFSWQEVDAL